MAIALSFATFGLERSWWLHNLFELLSDEADLTLGSAQPPP